MEIATIGNDKSLSLYKRMAMAISECHSFDECKDIIDKSVGLAAYYEQIKDTETERKFHEIKLRAWKRIADLMSDVDLSNCPTQSAKVKKVRSSFNSTVVSEFSDSRILQMIKLMQVSADSFEIAVSGTTRGSIDQLIADTPEKKAELAAQRKVFESRLREQENDPEYQKQLAERARQIEQENLEAQAMLAQKRRHEKELLDASTQAMDEVGITLERKDRAHMKSVVFLIKDDIHAVMRKAAFDEKITMQEILRRGLKMWLIAHDYDFPEPKVEKRAASLAARA